MTIEPHKHGEPLVLDRREKPVHDAFVEITKLHTRSTEYLLVLILELQVKPKFEIPCRQCMLDTAIDFRDIAALLEELAGEKVKV